MPPGRYGLLGAIVAHTEAAKIESTAMITKQSGQISKLDGAMQKSAEMMQQLMQMTGANEQKTKVLAGQVNEIGAKTDIIIEALKVAGVAFPQPPGSSTTQLTQSGGGATPAAAGAPASAPPAGNAWLTATGGSGRGGGSKKRGADGRIGVGAPVGEGFDGLDDDSSSLPKSPTLRERLRSSMWRMAALARMGASERDGEEGERLEPRRWQRRTKDGSYGRDLWEPQTAVRV